MSSTSSIQTCATLKLEQCGEHAQFCLPTVNEKRKPDFKAR